MRGHCRSGGASSTSLTSKPSRVRPGVCWGKDEQRAPPRRRLCSAFPGRLAPEHVQIGASPLPGRRSLSTLNLEELYDIFPLSTGCLPGPQVYVKEHLGPAGDLPFQLGLEGVPLAQKETIDLLLGGFYARDSIEQVADLAQGLPEPLFWALFLCFVLSHERHLLCSLHPVSPVLWGRAQKKKATRRSVYTYTYDANGYQATSSDRCCL